ncbi:MAG: dihydroorotate dehydrogenase electron transfer subunit [Candidatus Marinimicrobia bacterium]|jgi:dihydroorotate dehydrogenase electron transfer subunit|nr:dihydroorotate dehydrogenase electron transfer subunit [Candidatus Neomarinimicrobiota bacterium]MCK9483112.1 dihydroorotate dehydrogenase electron transfer subunit [Candidatus Neomarinimicrobiota bacterium]MCK9560034.1 dihydroorotate dehydrogenase electron transfer subunit [Candidatus Neomarinimicrobiota bacterium]MDD5061253.1 dihydroorotate dehydrogenase electron transfer subunit [Candidatus Neomarinimicrobiota bacterium]MDD5541053.1 dihydroorotate dehydrogenase electron transfer subunit [
MRYFKDTTVLNNQMICTDVYLLEFAFPEISNSVEPGQFINIYFPGKTQLFPRPFSIAGVDGEKIKILYKKVGCLTEIMSQWQSGQNIRVLGALGNQFDIRNQQSVLIAGGIGLAPLLFLNARLEKLNYPIINFIGALSGNQLPLFNSMSGKTIIATDDGSQGYCGNVVDCFRQKLDSISRPFSVYACGPDAMLSALWRLAREHKFDLQLSLEKIMACGLGICQGCAIPHAKPADHPLRLVCQDGPVFNANELELS